MPSRSPPPDAEKKEETKKDMGYVLVYMFFFHSYYNYVDEGFYFIQWVSKYECLL